ncbi:MAG: ATP-binding protein [Rubrivivax sp.]|nr:MAG: ATP-binding protein [Rubrivivax sp.]
MVATIHLLHGLPGCGKTRFAQRLAADRRGVHLNHDEWVVRLFGARPTTAQIETVREPIHDMLWTTLTRIVAAGSDVVLDFGFWTRLERDAARARVRAAGASPLLYTFNCSPALAWERVERRNSLALADALHIDEQAFMQFVERIEPPTPDEAPILVRD